MNSVVFRTSGQELTTTGTYTEMASRPAEPVLLGLAALAIRGRNEWMSDAGGFPAAAPLIRGQVGLRPCSAAPPLSVRPLP